MADLLQRYAVPCTPPIWARSGHAQTLFAHLLPSPGARITRRHGITAREVEVDDGESLLVFQIQGKSGVRVHLFHGLSGDVNSEYMRRTAEVLAECGHDVWAVNHRGCGEGRGLAWQPYHSGKIEDLAQVLSASRKEAPDRIHLVVGFSLSGNIGLLHAAQTSLPQPDGVIAVNPPVDLKRVSDDIHLGLCRLYERRFMRRLRRAVVERRRDGLARRHYEIPLNASLRMFDDLFTAPECGFSDALDYYRRCSSHSQLDKVEIPAVILTSADDPFIDSSVYDRVSRSETVFLHIEPSGGHVGYLTRRGFFAGRWLDGALVHYVSELAGLAVIRQNRTS